MAVNIVRDIDDWVRVQQVLISVTDKTGLDVLVPGLVSGHENLKLFSTGGTYQRIAGILRESGEKKHRSRLFDFTREPQHHGGVLQDRNGKCSLRARPAL